MKYSILITVYNKEKYIQRCLDFACNQTYKNYEVIVVNDGSIDGSDEIIKELQKRYGFRYYSKANSGIADTRNFIISKVTTPFFIFVDADDYIALDCLDTLDKYVTNDCDMLSFDGVFYNEDYSVKKDINKPIVEGTGVDFFVACLDATSDFVYPWGYVYRTEFFRKHNFKYRKGYLLDDFCVTPFVILESKRFVAIDYKGYYYFEVPNSIMTKKGNDKIMYDTYEYFFDSLLEQNERGTYSEHGKNNYHYYLIYAMLWVGENLTWIEQIKYIKRLKMKSAYTYLRKRGKYERKICTLMDFYLYYPWLKLRKIYNDLKRVKRKVANFYMADQKLKELLTNRGYSYADYLKIINNMQDDESKQIFYYRVMAGLTDDVYYNLKLVQTSLKYSVAQNIEILNIKYLIDFLLSDRNYNRFIYFIGNNDYLINNIKDLSKNMHMRIKCVYYSDKDELSEELNPSISYVKMDSSLKYDPYGVYIIVDDKYRYIQKTLINKNVSEKHIYVTIGTWPWYSRIPYFDDNIIQPIDKEVYVDCGAYNLDTVEFFLAWSKYNYEKIYAFEPISELNVECQNKINQNNIANIELSNLAIWQKSDERPFIYRDHGASTISLQMIGDSRIADKKIPTTSIDEYLDGKRVTLIKYDVEGAEEAAINGSIKTIKNYRPRIVMSAYHFPLDVIKLGLQILEINPNYRFYLRHQSFTTYKTILYCINKTDLLEKTNDK